jgi:hypothetical protein
VYFIHRTLSLASLSSSSSSTLLGSASDSVHEFGVTLGEGCPRLVHSTVNAPKSSDKAEFVTVLQTDDLWFGSVSVSVGWGCQEERGGTDTKAEHGVQSASSEPGVEGWY